MLRILIVLATLAAAEPVLAGESGCGFVAELQGKPTVVGPFKELRVLGGPERLPLIEADGGKLLAVVCDRDSIVPDVRDFRVPRIMGVPLYLNRDEPAATVEINASRDGPFIRLIDGQWTAAEEAEIRQVLSRAQNQGP